MSKVEATTDEIETLPNGARQSKLTERCDLLPAGAMLVLSRVLAEGAVKYGDNNWRGIPTNSHINHAMRHLFLFMDGDKSEEHLAHALCRLSMALQRHLDEQALMKVMGELAQAAREHGKRMKTAKARSKVRSKKGRR